MSTLSHSAHTFHAIKHGFEDDNHVSGSLKAGMGGMMGAMTVAAVVSAPVTLPILAAAATAAAVGRFIFKAIES